MKAKKLFLVIVLVVTTCMLFVTACKKKPSDIKPSSNKVHYELIILRSEERSMIVFDKHTSPIASVSYSADWFTASAANEMVHGHPALVVVSKLDTYDRLAEATVNVTLASGEEIVVLVRQGIQLFGDAYVGENMEFIANWENCDTVRVNGVENPVGTPWASESQTNIPLDVRQQYKRAHGWEMAFCSLNNTATPQICYFALYNKWTGILRVFHYIPDPTGYGNEMVYCVWMGRQDSQNNAPYYSSLEYGIPANHQMGSSLKPYANLIGGGGRTMTQTQSFQSWVTPYLQSTTGLVSGWYCFDIDMSGYTPGGTQWRDVQDDVKMTIVPVISQTQDVTLRGSLVGDISGTFDNPDMVHYGGGNAMSGICGIIDQITSTATSNIGTAVEYANAMKTATGIAEYLNPLKYYGGLAGSIASSLLGMIGEQMAEPETYDYIPGKMDMKLDAQLDLSGTISYYTSVDQAIFNVSPQNIDNTNGADGHMGRGIWSLAEDPVVYIDKDDLIAEYDHFTIMDNMDGSGYTASDFENYGVRFMWFFDPTSVKINLNRDLFPDVTEVKVTTTCGIYTGRPMGSSDAFRDFLTFDERPTFTLNSDTTSKIVRLGPESSPAIIQATREDLLITGNTEFETPDNCDVVQQNGGYYRYYGYNAEAANKTVMVDPQIYLAYNGSAIEMPKAPEFVVTVNVVFETAGGLFGGNTQVYSKCFVPKIQIIDRATTLQMRDKLQQYHDNSQNGLPTGHLANGDAAVYSPDGDRLIQRTLVRLGLIE
ncbi:MAG: hypothetical protein IJT45_08140 [Bacteroidales bacterium]|nr:hypothetical protein [Bacteroidales bacterium]